MIKPDDSLPATELAPTVPPPPENVQLLLETFLNENNLKLVPVVITPVTRNLIPLADFSHLLPEGFGNFSFVVVKEK